MARTPSTMRPLGTPAPDFALPDLDGRPRTLGEFAGAPLLLVMFICNHCPFVKHVRAGLAALGRDLREKRVAVVAINSNDVDTHPDDAPDKMKVEAEAAGYVFPYLFDATQAVARAYGAACTPDFFLYDRERRLIYRGQMDGSRPGNDVPVTGIDLRTAVDAALAGRPVTSDQRPSLGCNIKWKPGNEPTA